MQVDKVKAASSRRLHVSCSPLGTWSRTGGRPPGTGGGATLPLLIVAHLYVPIPRQHDWEARETHVFTTGLSGATRITA